MSTQNQILLQWNTIPYSNTISIEWREKILHVKIEVFETPNGYKRKIIYNFNGSLYSCELSRFKWTGGTNGVLPPEISTSTHKLIIQSKMNSLLFEDSLIQKEESTIDQVESPFKLIKTPSSVLFEVPKRTVGIQQRKESVNEVSLYDFTNSDTATNVFAYFDEENLIVDYWTLGNKFEEENAISIGKKSLDSFMNSLALSDRSNSNVFRTLKMSFNGVKAFQLIQEFLNKNEIPFERLKHSHLSS